MKNKAQRILDSLKEAEEQPNLPGMGPKNYFMSKTYVVVTPESAEQGDVEDHGFEYESMSFDSLWSIAYEIRKAGSMEKSSSGPATSRDWYTTIDGEDDYETGSETTYSFHPKDLSDGEAKELDRLINMNDRDFNAAEPGMED